VWATWGDSWGDHRNAVVQGHRYPVEIINHCVWLYFRFPLSFREVESATEWRTEMADRFAVWRQVTAPDAAA